MDAKRARIVALAALTLALATVLAWQFRGEPDTQGATTARQAPGTPATGASARAAAPVPQVAIALLGHPRPEPADTARDPFKFDARGSRRRAAAGDDEEDDGLPGTAGSRPAAGSAVPSAPQEPPGPPPPPPIPLKFIGLVQQAGAAGRIAVLSDGRGVYHGREGDVVEGRYRIVRIGNESIELVYLDGRGRQVIRLSGA